MEIAVAYTPIIKNLLQTSSLFVIYFNHESLLDLKIIRLLLRKTEIRRLEQD